jgi:hypothetical protein
MKLGQQVDGHLAFAPGLRPPGLGRSGQGLAPRRGAAGAQSSKEREGEQPAAWQTPKLRR